MIKHGLTIRGHHHPHYDRHRQMMNRCYKPEHIAFVNYGGRGIQVCPEWHDVTVFCAWLDANLGPCPEGMSLDRVDVDGAYEPGNVRWATHTEQANNKTPTSEEARVAWIANLGTGQLGRLKLSPEQAEAVRSRYAEGVSQASVAREFGVSQKTVSNVVHYRHYSGAY